MKYLYLLAPMGAWCPLWTAVPAFTQTPEPLASEALKVPHEAHDLQFLDSIAASVNQWIILESDVQMLLKVLKGQASNSNRSAESLREEALEQLIEIALFVDHYKTQINGQMQQMQQQGLALGEEHKAFLDIFCGASAQTVAFRLFERHLRQYSDQEAHCIEKNREEAHRIGCDFQLYNQFYWGKIYVDYCIKRTEADRSVQTQIILPEQLNKEVLELTQQLLESGSFKLQSFKMELPSPQEEQAILELEASMERLVEGVTNGDEFRALALQYGLSEAKKGLPIPDLLPLTNWNHMPAELKAMVKDLKGGAIFGPFRRDQYIEMIRIHEFSVKALSQKVKKYKVRMILKKVDAIINDTVVRRRMNRWAREILNDQATFEQIAKEHSDELQYADQGGVLPWGTIDELSQDVKVQHAITQLTKAKPLSRPIRGERGWYLVEWMDEKEESQDPMQMQALKARAREQIRYRAVEIYLRKLSEHLKTKAVIRKFPTVKTEK